MSLDRDTNNPPVWDREVDVLVVGSGAAGLTSAVVAAARGASVLVIEKSELFGGTSATSGGGVWIPCSPLAAAAGARDSEADAFRYLRALADDHVEDARIRAYIAGAPAMLRWMTEHTGLRFVSMAYPDYHPELAGGKTGWRTHFPQEFDGRTLGPLVDLIREESPVASLFGRINWKVSETYSLLLRPRGWQRLLAAMLWRYYGDIGQRLRCSRRDRFLTLGNALIGRLLEAAQQYGVSLQRDSALLELLRDESATRIAGALVACAGKRLRIRARRAVMLASGGFERDARMRAEHLPPLAADPGNSGSQRNNTGDGLRAAQAVGAKVLNMDSAWWAPVFRIPGEERGRLCAVERGLPGCIMVNRAGRRYMNEAASYHIAAQRMMACDQPGAGTAPSYILFDSRYRRCYPMGPLLPLLPLWLHSRAVRSTVFKAGSWEELATRTQLPASALRETIERFNENARAGLDIEFRRGVSEFDRYSGDPKVTPNPSLAPLDRPPFYAMRLHIGDIGTNGGLATDEHARVLDASAIPIPGLYAAGNTTASVMGHTYPGAGATLGPAMTFGFLAGLHMTGAEPT